MAFTYMLRCADGSYYVGSARNLEQRLGEHELGMGSAYTRTRLPVTLVWVEEFDNIGDAFNREKQVQNWGRAKREALIEQRYEDLPGLARGYGPVSTRSLRSLLDQRTERRRGEVEGQGR